MKPNGIVLMHSSCFRASCNAGLDYSLASKIPALERTPKAALNTRELEILRKNSFCGDFLTYPASHFME